jgi:hypothetical protein
MNAEQKLEKIKMQNIARQKKYLDDPEKAARHAAANKASYLKRKEKLKEPIKQVSFANPYGEVEEDEFMKQELKKHLKEIKEKEQLPTTIIVKKSALAKIAKIKLNKKPISLAEIKDKIVEKVESKASQEMYINSMKRILKLFDTDDLIKVIYDKSLVEKITGDRPIKDVEGNIIKMIPTPVNTAKADLQAILKIVDTFPISISEKLKSKIKTAFDVLKEKSFEKSAEPKDDLITFDDYIKKIEDKFGKESKQYVVVSLYHELPLRDDMQLKIVDSVKATKDKEFNYLVLNKSPKGRVVIHNYKTSKGLGTIDKELTTRLTNILKKYMNSKDDKDRQYLFSDKKMSSYVQKMNKAIGLKSGINLMRHMAVTEFLNEPNTAEQKVQKSADMGHSTSTQKKYKQTKKDT